MIRKVASPNRHVKAVRLAVLVALLAAAISVTDAASRPGSASGRVAAVQSCSPRIHIRDRLLAVATVTSARDMTCPAARKVVRQHGRKAHPKDTRGSHFRLGQFRCVVLSVVEEARRGRCHLGGRAFRLEYGS
jgi:hypothetical protein